MTEAVMAAAALLSAASAVFSALVWAGRKRPGEARGENHDSAEGAEEKRLWDEGVAGILGYSPDRGRGGRG